MDKTLNFIQKAKAVYGERFDYTNTVYTNARSKVKIICKLHGEYEQLPLNHLRQNCPNCTSIKFSKERTNNFEQFRKHLSTFHLEKYDYSKLTVFGFKDKGVIICPVHGEFTQNLKNHIASKGCPKCGRKASVEKVSMTKQQLIDKLVKVNLPKIISGELKDNLYTYKSVISCTCKIHGAFDKKVYDLLRGITCVKCRFKGYSRTEFINFCKRRDKDKAHFYLIRIYNQQENFYKIGITSTSVKDRFRKLLTFTGYSYEIIKTISSTPRVIWDMENKYKKLFSLYSYTPKIYFAGYTECFNEKIIENDI